MKTHGGFIAFISLVAIGSPAAGQNTPAPGVIDTVPPRTVIETPFAFQSGTLTLPGTLTRPANALTLRYSIPDAPSGGVITSSPGSTSVISARYMASCDPAVMII